MKGGKVDMYIIIQFSGNTEEIYNNTEDAEDAILEAHAEGVGIESVYDTENNPYSCIWTVKLQKEK